MKSLDTKYGARAELFWYSFLLLFAEIMAIRWLSSEVPIVNLHPNLIIMIIFVGAAAGMGNVQRWKNWGLLLPAALLALIVPVIFSVQLGLPGLHLRISPDGSWLGPAKACLALVVLTACLLTVFVNLGKKLGCALNKLPPLQAYSLNLMGSIAGVLAFGVVSWLKLPPPYWLAICATVVWVLIRRPLVAVVATVLIVLAAITSHDSLWSPYNKINVYPANSQHDRVGQSNEFAVHTNNFFMLYSLKTLSAEAEKSLCQQANLSPAMAEICYYHKLLKLPYIFAPKHESVLVLGGGTGNDAAFALREGVAHVDVVEIDPVIVDLGKRLHPDRPYLDPRVTLYNDDARAFLRHAKKKYDLIEFAYLDSGVQRHSVSFRREDKYVYTLESFQSALKHLSPQGIVLIAFSGRGNELGVRRLYSTIAKAAHAPPLVFAGNHGTVYIFGPGLAQQPQLEEKYLQVLKNLNFAKLRIAEQEIACQVFLAVASDNWPFVHLNFATEGFWLYLGVLACLILAPAVYLSTIKGSEVRTSEWGNMFFLGVGFMLIEIKALSQLTLFFGVTWLVSSVVVLTILLLAWIANFLILSFPKLQQNMSNPHKIGTVYLGLAFSLIIDFFWSPDMMALMSAPAFLVVAATSLIACLPVFFSGLIFSACFQQTQNPAKLLSANLLGAAVGGLLESISLWTGIRSLSLVALVIYGLSYLCNRANARKYQSNFIQEAKLSEQ